MKTRFVGDTDGSLLWITFEKSKIIDDLNLKKMFSRFISCQTYGISGKSSLLVVNTKTGFYTIYIVYLKII